MSLIITMFVREGIVMASDSRLTLSRQDRINDSQVVNNAVSLSDSNYKTFLSPCNIGISTYGAADIDGVPLGGYIESFIREQLSDDSCSVDEAPGKLLDYFSRFSPPPETCFMVAGYKDEGGEKVQRVWHVDIASRAVELRNAHWHHGASWGGESDILSRLLHSVGTMEDGAFRELPAYELPWNFFTLQDAIDFCIFAVHATIEAIRFQPRPKTVGGPIDVLVIKPDNAFWIQRKELRGRQDRL